MTTFIDKTSWGLNRKINMFQIKNRSFITQLTVYALPVSYQYIICIELLSSFLYDRIDY